MVVPSASSLLPLGQDEKRFDAILIKSIYFKAPFLARCEHPVVQELLSTRSTLTEPQCET
jgi:hypothetical protein